GIGDCVAPFVHQSAKFAIRADLGRAFVKAAKPNRVRPAMSVCVHVGIAAAFGQIVGDLVRKEIVADAVVVLGHLVITALIERAIPSLVQGVGAIRAGVQLPCRQGSEILRIAVGDDCIGLFSGGAAIEAWCFGAALGLLFRCFSNGLALGKLGLTSIQN